VTFKVAIIGRPNVGKSTLFNRLVGRKLALVDDTPGVTRDRRVHAAKLYDLHFDVIDTAGFEDAGANTLPGRMRAQTEIAIREADLIFFTVDAKSGLMPDDKTFAEIVRKSGKPVVLVANKAEAKGAQGGMLEAWELGLGEPIPVSAEHGQGMPDLRDAVIEALGEARAFGEEDEEGNEEIAASEVLIGEDITDPDAEDAPAYDDTKPMRIAVVGRPNAGKSTLINALIGEERLLTGPEAGITRDSISVDWDWRGRRIKLFDTAGMRRKARIHEKLEVMSVQDGLRAIRRGMQRIDAELLQIVSPAGATGPQRTPALSVLATPGGAQELQLLRLDDTRGVRRTGFRFTEARLDWLLWNGREPVGEPTIETLLDGVRTVRWRFLHDNIRVDAWPPSPDKPDALPDAVILEMDLAGIGLVTRMISLH